jgi:hypothetical protein
VETRSLDRGSQEFLSCKHRFFADAVKASGLAAIESREQLPPLTIGKRSYVRVRTECLGCQRLQTRNGDDRLSGYLGPGFHGGKPNANPRKGSRPGGRNVAVNIGEGHHGGR